MLGQLRGSGVWVPAECQLLSSSKPTHCITIIYKLESMSKFIIYMIYNVFTWKVRLSPPAACPVGSPGCTIYLRLSLIWRIPRWWELCTPHFQMCILWRSSCYDGDILMTMPRHLPPPREFFAPRFQTCPSTGSQSDQCSSRAER